MEVNMETDLSYLITISESHIADSLPANLENFGGYIVPRIFNYYLEGMVRRPGGRIRPTTPAHLKSEVAILLTTGHAVLQGYTMQHTEEQIYEIADMLNEYDTYLAKTWEGEEAFIEKICTLIYEILFEDNSLKYLIDNIGLFETIEASQSRGVYKFKITCKVF